MTHDGLITTREASELIGRPKGTINYWLAGGRIKVIRQGIHKGSWVKFLDPDEVRAVAARMDAMPGMAALRACHAIRGKQERETLADLEATIARQMENLPSWWWSESERMGFGNDERVEHDEPEHVRGWGSGGYALHPSTEPGAIQATHGALVAEHLRWHPGATAAEVSEAVVLPVWCVVRAMAALGDVARKEAA